MKNGPAGGRGAEGLSSSIANKIDLEYLQSVLDRDHYTDAETAALGHILVGQNHLRLRGIPDAHLKILDTLEQDIRAHRAGLSQYAETKALEVLRAARDGHQESLQRMLRFAKRRQEAAEQGNREPQTD